MSGRLYFRCTSAVDNLYLLIVVMLTSKSAALILPVLGGGLPVSLTARVVPGRLFATLVLVPGVYINFPQVQGVWTTGAQRQRAISPRRSPLLRPRQPRTALLAAPDMVPGDARGPRVVLLGGEEKALLAVFVPCVDGCPDSSCLKKNK